jgi:thiol peroxidase
MATRFLTNLFLLTGLIILPAGCEHNAGRSKSAATERPDLVTARGKPLTLIGKMPQAGEMAPAFTAVANDMSTFTFDPKAGQVWVLTSVPSLDTPVCSAETKRFNEEAAKLGPGVTVLAISMDLPFAQKRWCGAEGVSGVQTLSDARDRSFARKYGLQVKETGLLARAVFVVGKDGKITHAQLVPELTNEPIYEPILVAARLSADEK